MRTILLVGGGHAHVHVVAELGRRRLPGWRVRLVAPARLSPYSGMLPGVIAGHYSPQEMTIDLERLCAAHGVDFVEDRACGLDRAGRRLDLESGGQVGYELMSLDIGIEADIDALPGADMHAIAVKPIGTLLEKIDPLLAAARAAARPFRIAVIGGGAGGVELLLALMWRIESETGRRPETILIEGGKLLATTGRRARALVRQVLVGHGVSVIEAARAVAVDASGVRLDDGRRLDADAVLMAIGGRAPRWLSRTGLALEGGFVAVAPTLRSLNDDHVFAAGDCAALVETPRAKAGVFAVRAGPPLARNLQAAAEGRDLHAWRPQRRHLALISTGGKDAVMSYGGFACRAGWLWRIKDRIDRTWVGRYQY